MFKVGITGGIGSGKSTVCKIFETLGIPIFNADSEAKKLLDTKEVKSFYLKEFGDSVFTDGILDRKRIADHIFSDKDALIKVNEFIHPLVKKLFENWCSQNNQQDYVIKEAALLFESGLYHALDYNILIIAPVEIRIERIIHRDNASKEIVLKRINNQWSDEKKIPLANKIIINDDSQALLPQVLELDHYIKITLKK
jgi:dephospho-CoA kinase